MLNRKPLSSFAEPLESRTLFTTVTIDPITVVEDQSALFTATLDAAATQDVVVSYKIGNKSARVGMDFERAAGLLTFAAGQTSAQFSVVTIDDNISEPDEVFMVRLKTSRGVQLAQRAVTGTITDDEAAPTVSIADLQVAEGNRGSTDAMAIVSLSNPSSLPIRLSYSTEDGTATAGSDYRGAHGTLNFRPGATEGRIKVKVTGDTAAESDETVVLNIESGSNATLEANTFSTITITDDDSGIALPLASITSIEKIEGNTGTSTADFIVSLASATTRTVTVTYKTVDGTAKAGVDYIAAMGTLTFAAGETTKVISVTINGDTAVEVSETFTVELTSAANATIANSATGTITNDDSSTGGGDDSGTTLPTLSIAAASVLEGSSGTTTLSVPVTLSTASTDIVTVAYSTANGTATAGADYTATTGTLIFAAGETSGTISVIVAGDTTVEPDETITLTLSGPTNATLATTTAIATILNDDVSATPTPTVSVAAASVAEGNSGMTTLTIPVTLSAASTKAVTVSYATSNGTAIAGTDYTAASGELTFAAGETSKSISITVTGDTTVESDETINVTLTSPTNATLGTATAVGTITNDDATTSTGDASTLTDNLAAASGGVETATGTTKLAASFKTGASAVTLQSVMLLLSQGTSASLATVQIFSDAGLQPGTLVGTLTSPASYATTLGQAMFTSSGLSLAANATYWVVLSANSGSVNWSWTEENEGTGDGFTGEWGSSTDGGTTWFTNDAFPLQMQVAVA